MVAHRQSSEEGVLLSRPAQRKAPTTSASGTFPIGLGVPRDALIHVPANTPPDNPSPLLIMLHGAGASASDVLPMVADCAERHGVLTILPQSRGATWDMLQRGYGPDVRLIDGALSKVFQTYAVDSHRIAIAGFSDGASYALSLGIINGELFSDILAFSPGFAAPSRATDAPRIFISHGREDPVLPVDRCGRRIAAAVEASGYDLDYREFIGGHVVPTEMVAAAFDRLIGRSGN